MNIKLKRTLWLSIVSKAAYLRLKGLARYNLAFSFLALREAGITTGRETLLDVGAHVGLFSRSYQACFPEASLILIEPVKKFRSQISANLHNTAKCEILPYAAGNNSDSLEINVSDLPAATSLLKISDKHEKLWPGSSIVKKEIINVRRLDVIIPRKENVSYYLKIDVQGFEEHALLGAAELLKQVTVCQIEVNFDTLFEGETPLFKVIKIMTDSGFRLVSVFDPIYGLDSFLPASADFVFVKNDN
jgi:FkbM family methyltransferase